jgi:hypothetical protein
MKTKSIVKHVFTGVGASVLLAAASLQSAEAAGPTSYQQFWDNVTKAPSVESVQASGERHQVAMSYQQSWDDLAKAPSVESVQASRERHQVAMSYQQSWDNLAKAPSVESVQASRQRDQERMSSQVPRGSSPLSLRQDDHNRSAHEETEPAPSARAREPAAIAAESPC